MAGTHELKTYQQWMECLEYLGTRPVTDEDVENLRRGSCPGIERVMPQFLERLQDTVNKMINRAARNCTSALNASLEENDFSNVETILYRSFRQMKRCRFYLNINFIPKDFAGELDKATVEATGRYWSEMNKYLTELADESGSEDVYDIQYYLNRLINKDKHNG